MRRCTSLNFCSTLGPWFSAPQPIPIPAAPPYAAAFATSVGTGVSPTLSGSRTACTPSSSASPYPVISPVRQALPCVNSTAALYMSSGVTRSPRRLAAARARNCTVNALVASLGANASGTNRVVMVPSAALVYRVPAITSPSSHFANRRFTEPGSHRDPAVSDASRPATNALS